MSTHVVIFRTILLSGLAVAIYFGYNTLYLHACQRVQTYTIGDIEASFSLGEYQVIEILEQVEKVWERPTGMQLFSYTSSKNADIIVNIQTKPGQEIVSNREFEKGDWYNGVVTINEFKNKNDLALVLAHEFGHTLNLTHVKGVRSVMHYLLDSDSVGLPQVSEYDLIEFAALCRAYNVKKDSVIR